MKNLAVIYEDVSDSYKVELKQYASLHSILTPRGKLPATSYALWVKMMFLFAKADPEHIDLVTLTYSDLQTMGDDILSIASAVTNGFMDNVPGAEMLTANM
jgi:ethanolamine utilization microcompartment shell protein EutS